MSSVLQHLSQVAPTLFITLLVLVDSAGEVRAYIGAPEEVESYNAIFNENYDFLHAMLMARTIASMEEIAKQSIEAPDDGSRPDLSSGYKLDETLKTAKDIKKRFFRNFFVTEVPVERSLGCWVPDKVDEATCQALAGPKFDAAKFKKLLAQEKPDATEGEDEILETVSRDKLADFDLNRNNVAQRFLAVYKQSKQTLKTIQGKQKTGLALILELVDFRTGFWVANYAISMAIEGVMPSTQMYINASIVFHAQQPDWKSTVPLDIYAFILVHLFDYFVNDVRVPSSAFPPTIFLSCASRFPVFQEYSASQDESCLQVPRETKSV